MHARTGNRTLDRLQAYAAAELSKPWESMYQARSYLPNRGKRSHSTTLLLYGSIVSKCTLGRWSGGVNSGGTFGVLLGSLGGVHVATTFACRACCRPLAWRRAAGAGVAPGSRQEHCHGLMKPVLRTCYALA